MVIACPSLLTQRKKVSVATQSIPQLSAQAHNSLGMSVLKGAVQPAMFHNRPVSVLDDVCTGPLADNAFREMLTPA